LLRMEQSTKREVADRVIELAEEPREGERRDDTEIEVVPGVRVDPAPLTYRGASIEVDHGIDDGLDLRLGIMDAVRDREGLEMFSATEHWDEGYWAGAVKDEGRTG